MPSKQHRKKPFSAKQKKQQLREKRERKKGRDGEDDVTGAGSPEEEHSDSKEDGSEQTETGTQGASVKSINQQPKKHGEKGYDPNRYRLHFLKETKEELDRRKKLAQEPLQPLPQKSLEICLEEVYVPGSVLDMPKRPTWSYKFSKHQLESREETYFREYLENILEKYGSEDLSYFELNLETWRQLWRVLEMADIILLITDIRHPALHFSPTLYDYVTKDLGKPLVLVLNKIDLAPPALVVAWKHYFQTKFPELHVVTFTSFPKVTQDVEEMNEDTGKRLQKRRRKQIKTAVGPKQLLEACEAIVRGTVDLSSWQEKIEGEAGGEVGEGQAGPEPQVQLEEGDGSFTQHEQYKDGILNIGCCGYPNVGKSSLMNGLMGKKVVSVSRTPGHTKHFQTIYLTPTVKLCDSPGLVFPSLVPKPMQTLAGIYPIAQVREPYTTVGYLAQRIPLPQLLNLKHPETEDGKEEKPVEWSALDICDAWAEKRKFMTAKAARNDVYRAANNILRLAVDGRLCLCMRPPGYLEKQEYWAQHPETVDIATLQQSLCQLQHSDSEGTEDLNFSESDGEEVEEEDSPEDNETETETNPRRTQKTEIVTSNPFALLGDED